MSNTGKVKVARAEVWQTKEYIWVRMPYDEDAKEELKTKFAARWDPDDKVWYIDAAAFDIMEVEKEVRVHFGKDMR